VCECGRKFVFSVKESLLGALMSLTLFPPNKHQSWPKEWGNGGDRGGFGGPKSEEADCIARHFTLASFRRFYYDFRGGDAAKSPK